MPSDLFTNVDSFIPGANYFLNSGGLQIDYFLAVRVNGVKTAVIPMPEQPNAVEVVDEFYENPIYTFRDDYAYREIAPPRRRKIRISGQVGTKRRINVKATNGIGSSELVNVPGDENLRNFEKFLRDYHTFASKNADPAVYSLAEMANDLNYSAGKPYLEIKCFPEKISGRCTVVSFNYSKDIASHRLGGYKWTLDLQVYDDTRMEQPLAFTPFGQWADTAADFLAKAQLALDVWSGIAEGVLSEGTDAARVAARAVSDLMSSVERLANVPFAAMNAANEIVRSVATVYNTTIATTLRIGNSYAEIGSYAANLFGDTGDMFRAKSLYHDIWANDGKPSGGAPGPQFSRANVANAAIAPAGIDLENSSQELQVGAVLDMLDALDNLLATLGVYRAAAARSYAPDATGFLRTDRGLDALASLNSEVIAPSGEANEVDFQGMYRSYTMRSGESLLTVANELMGDPSEWTVLARVNRCIDAYTLRDGSPIVPGTVIRVPLTRPMMMHSLGSSSLGSAAAQQDEYGVDFYIDPVTGDLVIADRDDGTETELSEGIENMSQAILIMLRTAVGDITSDPLFGTTAPNAIGSKFTEQGAALIVSDIVELLTSDPRILEVSNVVATPLYAKHRLEISMDVITYLGDTMSLKIPV